MTSSTTSHDRKMRYRVILQDLSLEQENDNNDQRMQKTTEAVHEVKKLLQQGGVEERVRHPGESYLDSRVLRAASDLAISCSEAVTGLENKYDKHELAQHIRENPTFWSFSLPREVSTSISLHGTFAPTPPEHRPKERQRRVAQKNAQLSAPESVDRLEKTDEGSEMVSRVHRFINKACRNGAKSYYHLVLDPTSFTKTIENIYYMSFLVRDGFISVYEHPEHGLPFVEPVPQTVQNEDSSDENQFIVSMNMERWRDLIEAFGITQPMMVLKRL
ncbi:EP300-interacting inhibitor of differentiation 3-like [Colias croceus]|uniref:EP300-interacting inhibitor of differentiation 3-like n=1 Tax=Colias crocea TaxID=72248 RepID=UPI001E27EDC5|nr:EP300-interacting inhibitor of differentiation 3-like [Colias croceus]